MLVVLSKSGTAKCMMSGADFTATSESGYPDWTFSILTLSSSDDQFISVDHYAPTT